jgi:hypothetical protein
LAEESLDKINTALGGRFKVAIVNADELEFLKKNARFMKTAMFNRLVENIKQDGQLSSVPFCMKVGEKYRVLSGNHRLQAAIKAGLTKFLVLYTDRDLSRSEEVAIQLSHNAIEGEDDVTVLKELWNEIDEINDKLYAGLDDKTLKAFDDVTLGSLSEVDILYQEASFLFLPGEKDRFDRAAAEAIKFVDAKTIDVFRLEEFDRLISALADVKKSYKIENRATALMLILDVFEEHKDDLNKDEKMRE